MITITDKGKLYPMRIGWPVADYPGVVNIVLEPGDIKTEDDAKWLLWFIQERMVKTS